MQKVLKLHPVDNVIVALQHLKANEIIDFEGVKFTIQHDIDAKHKFVIADINVGEPIIMYGVLVGKATQKISRGSQITTFNLKHDSQDYSTTKRVPYHWQKLDVSLWQKEQFMGYHRSDGLVGTRNFWLVVPLVFCENRNILIMKDAFERELGYAQPETYRSHVANLVAQHKAGSLVDLNQLDNNIIPKPDFEKRLFKNIDGIKFVTHEGGCGGTRQDATVLCNLFASYANNANVAGITVLSLGCQNAEYSIFMEAIKQRNPKFDKPILFFEQQKGTESELLSNAINETFLGLIEANKIERKPAPISKLNIGLKCGGSDGFSGISANPALGHLSDLVVSLGGTTLLAEFPELNGVEQELINRCIDEDKAAKFETLMRDYAGKAEAIGSSFAYNPSPGNIKDGLITDAIKSAGAARKGGNAPIVDVLNYTEMPTKTGLHLVCTPGNDVEAVTGQVASGATIVLFTTGLGTPTGNPICPVVKISTNYALSEKMADVIDFNTGTIITGEESIAENAEKLLKYIIDLASGKHITHAERLAQDDFIPWKRGVSL